MESERTPHGVGTRRARRAGTLPLDLFTRIASDVYETACGTARPLFRVPLRVRFIPFRNFDGAHHHALARTGAIGHVGERNVFAAIGIVQKTNGDDQLQHCEPLRSSTPLSRPISPEVASSHFYSCSWSNGMRRITPPQVAILSTKRHYFSHRRFYRRMRNERIWTKRNKNKASTNYVGQTSGPARFRSWDELPHRIHGVVIVFSLESVRRNATRAAFSLSDSVRSRTTVGASEGRTIKRPV